MWWAYTRAMALDEAGTLSQLQALLRDVIAAAISESMMVNRFREATMGAAIALREDYDAADLRRIAKGSKDAARIGATDLQVIRDWVLRFNAHGPSGLLDRKTPGHPPKLDTVQRQALAAIVESGPIPAIHGVVRWRLIDLRHWIWQAFAVSRDERSVGRILRAMNFVKMTARPRHHAQNQWALEDFKKTSPLGWRRSAKPCPPIRP